MRYTFRSQIHILVTVILFALFTFALTYLHTVEDPVSDNTAAPIPNVPQAGETETAASQTETTESADTEAAVIETGARLNVIIPRSDSLSVSQSRHRIAANTSPGSRAYINGEETTVYPSGAFAGIVDIPIGHTHTGITVISPSGDTLSKNFRFHRVDTPSVRPEMPEELYDEPRVAEIQGRRPYITSSTEIDRLGGRTLGFLDDGVLVEVTGRRGAYYRVRLTDRRDTYLPIRFANLLPEDTPVPRSTTGSLTVASQNKNDVVTLSVGARLPYLSAMKTDPNSIEIDIFGAEAGTNEVFHTSSIKAVQDVELTEVSEGHLRLRIKLEHDLHWGYQIGYGIGNSLRVSVRRPPGPVADKSALEGRYIAIDPGHGGDNLGALGATGITEKEIVLDISHRIREKLEEEGARVMLTRRGDENVPISERIDKIIASDADVLVSIHANSVSYNTNPVAIRGASVYYRYNGFRPLAQIIHRHMLELPLHDFGLIGNFNFSLNSITELPNMLVETAFLSNPEDEMKLLDPEFRNDIADKIVAALREFFREHGEPGSHSPS